MKVLLLNDHTNAYCMPGGYACADGGLEKMIEYHILLPVRHLYNEVVRLLTILSNRDVKNVSLMAVNRIQ